MSLCVDSYVLPGHWDVQYMDNVLKSDQTHGGSVHQVYSDVFQLEWQMK